MKGHICGKTKTLGVREGKIYRYDFYTFRGFPDLTCFCPHLIFLEIKSPQGRLSEAQQNFQSLCEKANIPYYVIRSLNDIISAIQ